MLFKKRTAVQKRYIEYLRDQVYNNTAKFKKRYKLFPWSKINRVPVRKYTNVINFSDKEYTVKELINEIKMAKQRIKTKIEPRYYFHYLNGFNKELRGCNNETSKKLFKQFKERLDNEFDAVESDFDFCLSSLRALNKFMKSESKNLNESVDDFIIDNMERLEEGYSMKNTTEYRNLVRELYEACSEGKITVEEREGLINRMDGNLILSGELDRIDHSLMAREKYDAVVKALYEKCQNGEISVDDRERLIEKAKCDIFQIIPENNFMDSQESVQPPAGAQPMTQNSNSNSMQKNMEKQNQNMQKQSEKIATDMNKDLDNTMKNMGK